jgi:hypothetical protein
MKMPSLPTGPFEIMQVQLEKVDVDPTAVLEADLLHATDHAKPQSSMQGHRSLDPGVSDRRDDLADARLSRLVE